MIFTHPLLWSFGGKEVEADGKTAAINSKQTVGANKFINAFWKEAPDEGRLCLGRFEQQPRLQVRHHFLHAQRCVDLYRALRKPDQYRTEKGEQMKNDIQHAPLPGGPAG